MQFILRLIFLLPFAVFGQSSLILINESSELREIQGAQFEFREDPTKSIDFAQALKLDYKPADFKTPNFGFANSSFWLRFRIFNSASEPLPIILGVKSPNLDLVALYSLRNNKVSQLETGDHFPFYQRAIPVRDFHFPLLLPAGDTTQFYLNVQNSGEQLHAPVLIGKPSDFSKINAREQLIFGLFFGVIVFAILINLFFFLVLRDTSTLFYIGFLLGLLLLQLSLTGLGFQYLWPESVYLANHMNPFAANLSIFFLLIFSIRFLQIKNYLPRINRIFKWLSVVVLIGSICSLIPNGSIFRYSVYSVNAITLILNILIIPVALYIYNKGYKPARFFAVAFIALIISVFLFIFKNLGLLPPGFVTEYGIQIGSALEVLLLTLAVIDRFRQFKEEAVRNLEEVNLLKTESNIRLEAKVIERTEEISRQKKEIEDKNSEIISSIRYARRIQEAILPNNNLLEIDGLQYFVLYLPRDIVSGDFYWFARTGDELLIAVADCTGHGVPGAFMSILGTNYLRQSLQELNEKSPGKILDYVNQNVISTLNQDGSENKVRDGMDISLIKLNLKKRVLEFSGANNPLYHISGDQLTILPADKQAIGSVGDEVKYYNQNSLNWKTGDMIYLFTDGFADQFGGPKGKKFKYTSFRSLLQEISILNPHAQKIRLEEEFHKWKGTLEQVDDVCVIGARLI